MAETMQKSAEDLTPFLTEMEKIRIFTNNEKNDIIKKIKMYEHKIQKITKSKEDYLTYIKYLMSIVKLIETRRNKCDNKEMMSVLNYTVSDKVYALYQTTICIFQDDIRFWMAHIQFCKHTKYKSSVPQIITNMLKIHQDKPNGWLIATMWEKEENNNMKAAEELLLKGLRIHPNSSLLLTNVFKLTLELAEQKKKNSADKENEDDCSADYIKKSELTYMHVLKKIKDVKILIEFLNIAKKYKSTETLQQKILTDLLEEFESEPLVWDTMARREFEGNSVRPVFNQSGLNKDCSENNTLKDRISLCNEVYKVAVKKINNDQIWSLYLNWLLEINIDTECLPNFKRKLLNNALVQGHKSRKLTEKYYLYWISMISNENSETVSNDNMYKVMTMATDAIPESTNLWNARLKYLLSIDDKNAAAIFSEAFSILKSNSLPLWKTNLLYIQAKYPEKTKEFFQTAMETEVTIANEMKVMYIEWLVLNEGIESARTTYEKICDVPPFCKKLHMKMADLEIMQLLIKPTNARYPHKMATKQFGTNDVDVWINFIIFEIKYGDAKQVTNICDQAFNTIHFSLIEEFRKKYNLITSNSNMINTPT